MIWVDAAGGRPVVGQRVQPSDRVTPERPGPGGGNGIFFALPE